MIGLDSRQQKELPDFALFFAASLLLAGCLLTACESGGELEQPTAEADRGAGTPIQETVEVKELLGDTVYQVWVDMTGFVPEAFEPVEGENRQEAFAEALGVKLEVESPPEAYILILQYDCYDPETGEQAGTLLLSKVAANGRTFDPLSKCELHLYDGFEKSCIDFTRCVLIRGDVVLL